VVVSEGNEIFFSSLIFIADIGGKLMQALRRK